MRLGRRLTRTLCTWNGEWNESERVSTIKGKKKLAMLREGHIDQLRVLGHGKGAELGAAIALELSGQVYAPIHDHRGNVCCLIDSTTGIVVEGYRYTAFGEFILYDHQGIALDQSLLGNPWLFAVSV